MDGIVPILYLLILLGALVSGVLSLILAIKFCVKKVKNQNTNKSEITTSIVNLVVASLASLLVLLGQNSVIGVSPLIYILPIIFVISLVVMIMNMGNL